MREKFPKNAELAAVYEHLYGIVCVSAYVAAVPAGGRETSPRRLALAVRAAVENGRRRDVK